MSSSDESMRGSRLVRPGKIDPRDDGLLVRVRNDTGSNRSRFEIVAVTGVETTPSADLNKFKNHTVFTVGMPAADSTKLVILQNSIKATKYGTGKIYGNSVVQIDMTDATHTYAKPTASDPTRLTSDATSGLFRILYVASGTGLKWGAVQWPIGGASTPTLFAKFDGSRTGKRYTGHIWTGSQGAAIQWLFVNDTGIDDIIDANELVEVFAVPGWFVAEHSSDYGSVASYGECYVARSPIWAVAG
jgi:hypothetical protein